MIVNIVLGAAVFGYAGWTLFKFFRKSKQGKCVGCSMNKSCQSACEDLTITP